VDEICGRHPNILLIVSEDNGPELGCYGDTYARTPVLDRLAAQGVRFDRAYVPYSVCSPSRACFLTGLYPHQNGQIGLATHKFAMYGNIPSMPSYLKDHGYFTGIIGKLHVNPADAFPFDFKKIGSANFGKGQRDMKKYAAAAAEFFAEAGTRPFFLSINYPDAHFPLHRQDHGLPEKPLTGKDVKPLPWVGADSPRLREFTADYYNSLARLDAGVGMLLDALDKTGKRENTLVFYIGDHGAQFSRGKCGVLEASLRVPLIAQGPGVKAGHATDALVSTLDLLPTMLAAVGLKVPAALPGMPLQPLLAGATRGGHRHILGYTNGSAPRLFYPQLSIRDARYRLVYNPLHGRTNLFAECYLNQFNPHFAAGTKASEVAAAPAAVRQAYATFLTPPPFELYDLDADPNEFANLAGQPVHREAQDRLWQAMKTWQRQTRDPHARPELFKEFVTEQDAQRSLAYRKQKGFRWSYLSSWSTWLTDVEPSQNTGGEEDVNTVAAYLAAAAVTATSVGAQTAVPETSTVFETGKPHGYRIPGIAVTRAGTALAFAERRIGLHDHAQNDIVLRRSLDGGRTWQPEQVLRDEGGDSLNDPCAVTLDTGRILLRYKRYPQGFHARKSGHTEVCDTGYEGLRVVRVYLMTSDDDGVTWTEPREITRQVRAAESVSAGSPGNGIQLTRGAHKGRVVMPLYETVYVDGKRTWKTRVMFSDDSGAAWKTGGYVPEGPPTGYGNEAAVAELSDGSILFSARNQGGSNRKLAVSRDGGMTWDAYIEHPQLITPACMGGLLRYSWPDGGKPGVLVHSLPFGKGRSRGTILVSRDDGKTWPVKRLLEPGAFAYSCLARLKDGSIGCLYEAGGYKQIKFARFPLAWVETKPDSFPGDFDGLPAGPITKLDSPLGSWTAAAGHGEIDPYHAHSGDRCLHIHGGKGRQVELALAKATPEGARLSFWAERWTARSPFSFRIEGMSNGKWREIYNGDREVKVGRSFLSKVKMPLGASVSRLRFTCTSPERSGILIDDMRVEVPGPMKVTRVTTEQAQTPVLIRNEADPVLQVEVHVEGDLKPASVKAIRITTAGTTRLADIENVRIIYGGAGGAFDLSRTFGGDTAKPAAEMTFKGEQELEPGVNMFWVAYKLKPSANVLNAVDAGCLEVAISDGSRVQPETASPPGAKRVGIALRRGGDDGVRVYRIPGLATTPKGTLIGVYDIRRRGGRDLPGDIDVGMSRSTDGGQTWEPMKAIMDMGRDPKWRYDGIGDPAVLVDRATGTIWVAAVWSHGNRGWHGSGPGTKPEETGQFMLVRSDDEGVTWSKPINITRQIKKPEWCFLLQGPGRGITMRDGTLVFPAQYQDTPANRRMPHSTIVYSRDHGKTWRIGTGAKPNTTESAVVELGDGSLMLNMRDNRGGARSVYTSRDMGATWTAHITSRKALPEPVCMASLLRIPANENVLGRDLLLFSNPAVSRAPRRRTTIKVSLDEGRTWPEAMHLLLDEGISAGYSCLTRVDGETVGILYEGSRAHMTFQRVRLSDFVK